MTLGSSERPIEILLVEDNPGDVELTKRILQDAESAVNIEVAEDGDIALSYLQHEGQYADSVRPDLILLDLAMPNKGGFEVLEVMNQSAELKPIPVMVLTSTQAQRSLVYSMGVPPSNYCPKPLNLTMFNNLVDRIKATPEPELEAVPVETSPPSKRWWWPFGNR
jgi:CheY-like chemotaxis protein